MAKLNRIEIIGHVGQNPELRHTNTNNVPVCNLRVAVNDKWKDKNTGEERKKTQWFTVVCYRGLAETVAKYCQSGKQVWIEGRMESRPYMGKAINNDDQPIMYDPNTQVEAKMYKWEIIATDVQFLGKKEGDSAYAADGSAQPQTNAFVPKPGAAAENQEVVDTTGQFVQPSTINAPEGV